MNYINIGNRCVVEFAPTIQTIRREFEHHLQDADRGLPIVGCVKVDESLAIPKDAIMLLDGRLFHHDKVLYVKESGEEYRLELTEKQFTITSKRDDAAGVLPVLIQTMLNFYMPCYGLAFLHTAACELNGEVIAIHGFGGAGKTETMLELLSRGASYISDDLAIFDEQGRIYPYLRRIGLHDYPFTEAQLQQFGLSRWRYRLMNHCKGKSDRLRNYLYRRLKGQFKINLDYTKFTGVRKTILKFYEVTCNYWLDSTCLTGFSIIPKERFVRKMTFCMGNEFRPYIDFDGYCDVVLPFWKDLRKSHDELLRKVLNNINIAGLTIQGKQYRELAELIMKHKTNKK